jgi:type I restriction enzyme S subunit
VSKVELSELVTDMRNGTTAAQNDEGRGLPVTRIETISDGTIDLKRVRHLDVELAAVERWRLRPGDIVLSHINSVEHIGKAALYAGEPDVLIHGMNLLLLRPDASKVLPEFLHFGLRSEEARAHIRARCKRAINQASINQKELGSVELSVPDLIEQRRIVDLLSRAENIVRMRKEAEAKVQEIIPALFLDMFGDPATNPKGWNVRKLGEIAQVVSGVAKGRRLTGKTTRDVPYLRVANVQAGHLSLLEMKTIPATESEIADLSVKPGDVLVTEGGDHDKLGRGALLDHDIGECIHQNHVFRVRAEPAELSPEYFVSYLQTEMAKTYFLKSAKKTTNLASINMTQLRALPMALPPLAVQTEFARHFDALRQLGADQARAVAISAQAFQSLLAGVFGDNGRVGPANA